MLNLRQIRFCAEEVERQGEGPIAVASMCAAFEEASQVRAITVDVVHVLGRLVDRNNEGFRTVPVVIDNRSAGVHWMVIPWQLDKLCQAVGEDSITPEEFYQQFEEIHPFKDGNGRVGAILYNLLNGSLGAPITPPMFRS